MGWGGVWSGRVGWLGWGGWGGVGSGGVGWGRMWDVGCGVARVGWGGVGCVGWGGVGSGVGLPPPPWTSRPAFKIVKIFTGFRIRKLFNLNMLNVLNLGKRTGFKVLKILKFI